MEFVLFFLALAMLSAQQHEISKLKKRIDSLESMTTEAVNV